MAPQEHDAFLSFAGLLAIAVRKQAGDTGMTGALRSATPAAPKLRNYFFRGLSGRARRFRHAGAGHGVSCYGRLSKNDSCANRSIMWPLIMARDYSGSRCQWSRGARAGRSFILSGLQQAAIDRMFAACA